MICPMYRRGAGLDAGGQRAPLGVSYGALFVAAMMIAVDTGVRISPELSPYLPAFVHGVIWGFAPLVLVVGATIILVGYELFFRRNKAQADASIETEAIVSTTQSRSIKDELYVGSMQPDTAALATEYFIELIVYAFNGTGYTIAITDVQGSIEAGCCPKEGGTVTKIGKLPIPRVKGETFPVTAIQHGEFLVALEQRIPRAMAERMAQVINAGDAVHLGLNDLKILVSSPHEKVVRLPIWNGVSIRECKTSIFPVGSSKLACTLLRPSCLPTLHRNSWTPGTVRLRLVKNE